MNPFEPPKPKLSAMMIMGSPGSRRMRYAATAAKMNNLSSDTDEAWADALDREEEEDDVYRQLRQEAIGGGEESTEVAGWESGNKRPKVRAHPE